MSLTFTPGSSENDTRCVNVTIMDDNALEGNQTFSVILSTSNPNVMLRTNVTTITIIDNDSKFFMCLSHCYMITIMCK